MNRTQAELEALYSQKQIHTVLHASIHAELSGFLINWALEMFYTIERYMAQDYYPSKNERIQVLRQLVESEGTARLLVLIAAAVLHTHSTQTIQQAVGYLQAFLPHADPFDRARTAGELLALGASDHSLYQIKRQGSGHNSLIQVHHWELVDKKLASSFDWINDTCFNLPLVEPPLPVTSNASCGYHTIREPVLLGDLTQHEEKQNYATLNYLNSIEWVLDWDVLAEPEIPAKPLHTQAQYEQFSHLVRDSHFVYKLLGTEPFWLAWQNDSRGRMYSHGYHVNLQAAEYKKASLSFNQYEELT